MKNYNDDENRDLRNRERRLSGDVLIKKMKSKILKTKKLRYKESKEN
jgi:hypothetical protein